MQFRPLVVLAAAASLAQACVVYQGALVNTYYNAELTDNGVVTCHVPAGSTPNGNNQWPFTCISGYSGYATFPGSVQTVVYNTPHGSYSFVPPLKAIDTSNGGSAIRIFESCEFGCTSCPFS
ncbi:hypothetical protein EXIGLDRAFT_700478 [Exidia glandulosa HHB12029]|uniref:Uncharacterized protein n=1 Tax=Exidia glandulosa HHB12029 TaxID=1314781 RepID=A0A165DEV1_EXIGL|nr:hypothetical protein EXIGLDRAFT_700478 [Exidia glandulosa HHB12029]